MLKYPLIVKLQLVKNAQWKNTTYYLGILYHKDPNNYNDKTA